MPYSSAFQEGADSHSYVASDAVFVPSGLVNLLTDRRTHLDSWRRSLYETPASPTAWECEQFRSCCVQRWRLFKHQFTRAMDLDSHATSSHKTRLRRHSNTPKLQHYTFNTPHTPHTRESATDRTPVIQKATPHIHPTTIPSAHFIALQRGDIFFEIVKGSFGSLAAENINHLNTDASENVPSVSRALEASTSTFVAAWQTSVLVALGHREDERHMALDNFEILTPSCHGSPACSDNVLGFVLLWSCSPAPNTSSSRHVEATNVPRNSDAARFALRARSSRRAPAQYTRVRHEAIVNLSSCTTFCRSRDNGCQLNTVHHLIALSSWSPTTSDSKSSRAITDAEHLS